MLNKALGAAALALLVDAGSAHAFCGFYVSGSGQKLTADATQVVLMRDGTRTVLSMQNDYKGPLEDFAMVVPVPVVLHEGDVKTLNPLLIDTKYDHYVTSYLFTPLLQLDANLLPTTAGSLTDKYEISADGKEYTFHLNPKATFSDGTPVLASDVVFTSGGTEANNLAIRGAAAAAPTGRRHLVTTGIEHEAVLNTMKAAQSFRGIHNQLVNFGPVFEFERRNAAVVLPENSS